MRGGERLRLGPRLRAGSPGMLLGRFNPWLPGPPRVLCGGEGRAEILGLIFAFPNPCPSQIRIFSSQIC